MDTLIGPFILFVVGCVLAGPILAIVALARIRRMAGLREPESGTEAHLDAIDARISMLSKRVAALERSAAAGTSAAPAAARPEPAPIRPPVSRPPAIPPTLDGRPPDAPPPGPVPRATSLPATPRERVIDESAPPSFTPPRPPAAPIDWERWIGIRGAAVVGAVALGLAGLLFLSSPIGKGWSRPLCRSCSGTSRGSGGSA